MSSRPMSTGTFDCYTIDRDGDRRWVLATLAMLLTVAGAVCTLMLG
jgi:hypothetical protein